MSERGTVLLVENNPDDIRLVELAFERAHIPHRLVTIDDAVQATHYLRGIGQYSDRLQFPFPEVVLLDLGMPGMGGFEFLQRLRQHPATEALPVTVLSGSNYLRDVTRAYQLGANSFLVKPSSLFHFTAAIKEAVEFWLDGKRVGAAPLYLHTPGQPTSGTSVGPFEA